jgi:hypothetical protein
VVVCHDGMVIRSNICERMMCMRCVALIVLYITKDKEIAFRLPFCQRVKGVYTAFFLSRTVKRLRRCEPSGLKQATGGDQGCFINGGVGTYLSGAAHCTVQDHYSRSAVDLPSGGSVGRTPSKVSTRCSIRADT